MRREEEHPWGGKLLRAGLVGEAQAGVEGSQGCNTMSIRQDGSGIKVTSPWDDPPAGAVRAIRKALIASPSENAFSCG